VKVK